MRWGQGHPLFTGDAATPGTSPDAPDAPAAHAEGGYQVLAIVIPPQPAPENPSPDHTPPGSSAPAA